MNCCMVTMAAPKNPGYIHLKKLQGRALKDKVALIPKQLAGHNAGRDAEPEEPQPLA